MQNAFDLVLDSILHHRPRPHRPQYSAVSLLSFVQCRAKYIRPRCPRTTMQDAFGLVLGETSRIWPRCPRPHQLQCSDVCLFQCSIEYVKCIQPCCMRTTQASYGFWPCPRPHQQYLASAYATLNAFVLVILGHTDHTWPSPFDNYVGCIWSHARPRHLGPR